MIRRVRVIRSSILAAALTGLLASPSVAQQPLVRIGTVLDGPWERNQEIRTKFEREITALLRRDYDVQFPAEKRIQADWSAAAVHDALDRLLADPEVDFVIAMGVVASNDLAQRGPLPKPVIAPFVVNPDLQGMPYQIRERRVAGRDTPERILVSGVANLSYVNIARDLQREVSRFLEIVPFTRLTVLTMQALYEAAPKLRENVFDQLGPLNLDVEVVTVGGSLEEALARIPADTEAVYVAPLLQLPPGDFDRLVQALIERRLPSFSLWGRTEVERGLLASVSLDLNIDRLARRVAINLQRILLGEQAADLAIDFRLDERLTINMQTARAIGVYPNWALLTEADLLFQPREQAARSLSLARVVREASQVNLDLAAADRNVAAGLQLVREARSPLLPQMEVSGQGLFIDRDRAEASFGSQGQRQASGSLGVSQLLYSENARAGYDIERSLQNLRGEERAQLRLDVILEAAEGYLNVLRTKTAEQIQRDNLRLTRRNLELAEARRDIGYSGPGEVFRWESQIATNRRDVIEASAQRNQAEIEVNRVLNRPLEEPYLTEETGLDDPELLVSFERLTPYLDNQQGFRIFRQFMAAEAFEGSPELRQLDASIQAQQRALLASKRAFYVPTVGVQADLTGFKNGGAGSSSPFEELPEGPTGFSFPTLNGLNWSVAIGASLPLFEGGALRARQSRARIELDQLTLQRDAVRQRVEQRIRFVLHQAQASFAGIQLTQDAAAAARKNLDLVGDSYSQGVLDIINLLDAQNQALVADLRAANAVYDFLIDLMNVQRAVGRFDYYRAPEDQQAFLGRLTQFFREAGYEPRTRRVPQR